MNHAREAIDKVLRDGDFDAVVYRIRNTGDRGDPSDDRYRHTINHGLSRVPVGCQIIMCDEFLRMKIINRDKSNIIVQFDKDRADVTLRIW